MRDWVASCADELRAVPCVLVASVDSECLVAGMPWFRAFAESDPSRVLSADPVVISGDSFAALVLGEHLLSGFDEVWLFEDLPTAGPAKEAYITCPRRLDEEIPEAVERWVAEAGPMLGVGDGCGLNYVATDVAQVRRFRLAES